MGIYDPKLEWWELQGALGVYERRGNQISALAPAVADSLVAEVLNVFETEGYGQWPRFWWERRGLPKPGEAFSGPIQRGQTKRQKRLLRRKKVSKRNRRWQGTPKLLQDTGNLVGSITPDHHGITAEAYTNVPYAKYHASRRPRSKIPLRDFFAIDQAAFTRDVTDMVLRFMATPIAAE
jgi:phage gpG-like protein